MAEIKSCLIKSPKNNLIPEKKHNLNSVSIQQMQPMQQQTIGPGAGQMPMPPMQMGQQAMDPMEQLAKLQFTFSTLLCELFRV
jgi:hypothetical protein